MATFNEQLNAWNMQINAFFSFVGNKLSHFKDLTRGEQVSYVSVGVGIVLVLNKL